MPFSVFSHALCRPATLPVLRIPSKRFQPVCSESNRGCAHDVSGSDAQEGMSSVPLPGFVTRFSDPPSARAVQMDKGEPRLLANAMRLPKGDHVGWMSE